MRLRNRVRQAREHRKLTRVALAELAQISRPTLLAVERDDGYEPVASIMTALCQALNNPELFWWERAEEPEAVAS